MHCLGSLDDLERETQNQLSTNPENMLAWLPLMYARGTYGGKALLGPTENTRYPSIVAETIADAIARGAV